jgi:DNA polymerase-1
MNARFAAAIAAASEASPMTNGSVPIIQGRTLYADGDGLAYYCAGNDDTLPGEARRRMIEKLDDAKRACGAESVTILTTASGSHKGHRYAVARVKPYQGQRSGKSRPKNWESLRALLDEGMVGQHPVVTTHIAEADDLFAHYAHRGDSVIYTQDKDMRMVPGWHLDWTTHILHHLPRGEFSKTMNDKLYGRKWFWQQVLMGDTADNIPGLPKYEARATVFKPIGEKTAEVFLDGVHSDMGALLVAQKLYQSFYKERWLVELLEQGILLWMREVPHDPFDVADIGNPFVSLRTHELWQPAQDEILERINEAVAYVRTPQAESIGDSPSPLGVLDEAAGPLRLVPTPRTVSEDRIGPRPLDGTGASSPAPDVQCPARESGEQLPPFRGVEPVGFPAWGRKLLAAV